MFVCLGNICRSPAVEGFARKKAAELGLDWQFDSSGTGAWHVNDPADTRMIEAAAQRGCDLSGLRAEQFLPPHFEAFDLIFAMDPDNLGVIETLRPKGDETPARLFLEEGGVPDPFYGDLAGFEAVLDMIEARLEDIFADLQAG